MDGGSRGPSDAGASKDAAGDLAAQLAEFLDDEDQLLASLGGAIDELVAASAAHRLDGAGRADLWRRIEAQVDPSA